MISAAPGKWNPAAGPGKDHQSNIEQGNSQYQYWHHPGHKINVWKAQFDGESRQDIAQEKRPAIAHKNRGAAPDEAKVVVDETERGPGESHTHQGYQPLAALVSCQEEKEGRYRADPAGQSVHVIHKVQGVRDSYDPQ